MHNPVKSYNSIVFFKYIAYIEQLFPLLVCSSTLITDECESITFYHFYERLSIHSCQQKLLIRPISDRKLLQDLHCILVHNAHIQLSQLGTVGRMALKEDLHNVY